MVTKPEARSQCLRTPHHARRSLDGSVWYVASRPTQYVWPNASLSRQTTENAYVRLVAGGQEAHVIAAGKASLEAEEWRDSR